MMNRRSSNVTRFSPALFLALFGFFFMPELGLADSFMYMDEAGNIHFADRVSHVPDQYKEQVVQPTPVDLDQKEYKKLLKEQEKKKEQAKKEKAKLESAEKKRRLKLKKKQLKELKKQQKIAKKTEQKPEQQ